jgi:hypothetical protein
MVPVHKPTMMAAAVGRGVEALLIEAWMAMAKYRLPGVTMKLSRMVMSGGDPMPASSPSLMRRPPAVEPRFIGSTALMVGPVTETLHPLLL